MSEAELIEIRHRYRKLEDAISALHPDAEFIDPEEVMGGEDCSPRGWLVELSERCCADMERMTDVIRGKA